jgi:hypothetical protein
MATTRMTRQQDTAIFTRICEDFLRADATSPIKLAFDRHPVSGTLDLLSLALGDVDYLSYIPATTAGAAAGPPEDLQLGHKSLVRLFLRWYREVLYVNNGNLHLNEAQWMNADVNNFNDFRMNSNIHPGATTTTPGTATPTIAAPKLASAVADFTKGIKRDAASYPMLKDQKHWNAWNRSVIAQARAHDVREVFDPTYIPSANDPEEIELFEKKQSFVYSVLNKCVMTDHGKSFVREHEHDFDAQAVYRKLLDHASKSTVADIAKDKLVAYLATAKLNSSWKGTTEGFLLHWQEQFRLLNDILPSEEHYAAAVKKRMLEAAVRQIPELQRIKDLDNNRVAAGGIALEYDAYYTALLSAAVQRDEMLQLPSSHNRRVVNYTDSDLYGGREEDWYDQGYLDAGHDIDIFDSEQFLSVNRMHQRPMNRNTNDTRTF